MTTKKADYIWFNGEMVRWEDAKVHVMSHALHYGTSVFEGIRCYDSHKGPVVFRHREHMQRLHDSAKIYRFPVSQSIDELMEACRDVIRKNNLTSAYIRPLIFVGDVGMGVNPPAGYSTDVIIAAFPWGAYLGAEALEQGIDAMVSSWNRAAPNTIPTAAKAGGNYLSSLLVGSEARRHGYQEGIFRHRQIHGDLDMFHFRSYIHFIIDSCRKYVKLRLGISGYIVIHILVPRHVEVFECVGFVTLIIQ